MDPTIIIATISALGTLSGYMWKRTALEKVIRMETTACGKFIEMHVESAKFAVL